MAKKRVSSGNVVTLRFDDNNLARDLFGSEDHHLRTLEKGLGIEISARGNSLELRGGMRNLEVAEDVLNKLYGLLKRGYPIIGSDVERAFRLISRDKNVDVENLFAESIFLPAKRRIIMPRSPAQKAYLEAIKANDVIFSIGPAGTGKSYLAVAMAVASLLKKEFERIVLARPAVEAGEKLGFLPGDMVEKVNPYLRPLYDALYDMLEADRVAELIEEDRIEIAPIAFMRGRTLHNSFIIIDEAQNTSYLQMKMCLTRLGMGSKMVITGDVTQTDLPLGCKSGLLEALRILKGCEGIYFHRFTDVDIVRHPIVTNIVNAYDTAEVRKDER